MCNEKRLAVLYNKRGNSYIEDDLYTQRKFSLRFAKGLIIFVKPIVCPVSKSTIVYKSKCRLRIAKRM